MIDNIFVLLSVFLGLLLLNGVLIVNAHLQRTGWIGGLTTDVRYLIFLSTILLVILNGNQWIAGRLLFSIIALVAVITVVVCIPRLTIQARKLALQDGLSLTSVQLITLAIFAILWDTGNYWLLEASNHDSLTYYQGLHWAMESPLFVSRDAVRAFWGLGVCGEGASWIGYDCPLYRGGTYTIAAWAQFFAPKITGSGLYLIVVYSATIAWCAVRFYLTLGTLLGAVKICFMALLVVFSTGIVGSLLNSNLATALGASALLPIIVLAQQVDLRPQIRFGLMSAWSAVAVHVYAESIFYAGLIIFFVFLIELKSRLSELRFTGVFKLIGLMTLIIFALGNIALGQAFSSLFLFGEIDKNNEWFSWYMHQSPALWIGGFIAGILMWDVKPQVSIVIMALLITLYSIIYLLNFRSTRSSIVGLVCTSLLAVLYVDVTGYQYGEHKILQLLGPAWALLLVASISRSLGWSNNDIHESPKSNLVKSLGWIILLSYLLIIQIFILRANTKLNHMQVTKGIDFGLSTLASFVRPIDTVLIDDNAWIGEEKFHKTHYLTFQLHNQGAKSLLPNLAGDPLRGGYFRASNGDTFRKVEKVDWLVQGIGHNSMSSRFIYGKEKHVWENSDYRLIRIGSEPVAVAGTGWYNCEVTHCWTSAQFEIETHVPQKGEYELVINFSVFNAPTNGTINISFDNDPKNLSFPSSNEQVRINLKPGWSKLTFYADWLIQSPLDIGVSGDGRKLFMAIKSVQINQLGLRLIK